jgi:hypothetical protein
MPGVQAAAMRAGDFLRHRTQAQVASTNGTSSVA